MDIKDFNLEDFEFDTNFDFGIKSVSTDQVDQTKIQTEKLEKVSASSDNLVLRLDQIETKLGEVLQIAQQKFETSLEEKQLQLDINSKEKFNKVEQLIIPLLMNLAKDSETNPYIHWPNRKQVVEEQIKRILTVTRE